MEQNITLIIGDNAAGKTRKLIEIGASADGFVASNLNEFKSPFQMISKVREKELNTMLEEDFPEEFTNKSHISELLALLKIDAQYLIIDELDVLLTRQEIVYVCEIIARMRENWNKIYISGYSADMLRLFTDIDPETDVNTYEHKILFINSDSGEAEDISNLERGDILEYFDKIRG